jgi:site-specific recombinase XerD
VDLNKNPYLFAKMIPVADIGAGKRSELKWWYRKPELVDKKQHLGTRAIEALTKRIGKSVGITPCNPHRFRHTCATLALRRGMDLTTVSKMLGHESVGTTQIYIDIDQQQLAAQHDKYVM